MKPWVLTYKDAKSLVICGDIHGEFVPLVYEMCVQYGMRDTLVIVAGDCGFGFEKPGAAGDESASGEGVSLAG